MAAMTHGNGARTNRWRIAGWGAAALLLLAPLAAGQLSAEPGWTAADFALAAVMLGGIGLGLELAVRRSGDSAYRIGAAIALATGVLLVATNGALGIIGSEREDANLLYLAAPAVALLGSLAARFRASGTAAAMAAAALATALVPPLASVLGIAVAPIWTAQVLALTGGFCALWLASAWFFRKAAA